MKQQWKQLRRTCTTCNKRTLNRRLLFICDAFSFSIFFLSFQYTADRLFTLYIFRTLKAPSRIHTHIILQFTPLHIVILRVFSFCRRCEFLSFEILYLSTSYSLLPWFLPSSFPFLLRCCFVVYDYFLLCWYGWERKRREHRWTSNTESWKICRHVAPVRLWNWYSNKRSLIPQLRRSFLQRKLDIFGSLDPDAFPLNRHCDHSSIRHAQYN